MNTIIAGVRIIRSTSHRINEPEDPSYPYKLTVVLRPPGCMDYTFATVFGPIEQLVAQGKTAEGLQQLLDHQPAGLRRHIRLIRWEITGPQGVVDQFRR